MSCTRRQPVGPGQRLRRSQIARDLRQINELGFFRNVRVFVEPTGDRAKEAEAYDDMVIDVVVAVHGRLGMRPGRVYLVEPRSIPMTANGKLQHALLRASYLDGRLRADGKILHPAY